MGTYSDYQNLEASEKLGLVVVQASRRLAGWVLDSGVIYKITDFGHSVIEEIADGDTGYTEVTAPGSLVPGSYLLDRTEKTLYLITLDSTNPNGKFLTCTFKNFFANNPVIAPHDLSSGFDVEWLPLVKETSFFGVEVDTSRDQLGIAIEGDGSVTFHNHKDYWVSRYDQWTWENKKVLIYSWNRGLPPTEARLIYRGSVQEKTYTFDAVSFRLKDLFNTLRAKIDLPKLADLSGILTPGAYALSLQRLIYGVVDGFRPQNISQGLDTGYTITGTIGGWVDPQTLTGTGSQWLTELRRGDSVFIEGLDPMFSISDVTSDTQLVLSTALSGSQLNQVAGKKLRVRPTLPKNYINREWLIASHPICEPTAEILGLSGPNLFRVDTVQDFEVGNTVNIEGTLATVSNIVGDDKIRVSALDFIPLPGDKIRRLTVTNLKIDKDELLYLRDFDYDPLTSRITLFNTAELNITPVNVLSGSIQYQAGSSTVLGSGTQFTTELNVNSWLPDPNGSFDDPSWIEVLDIVSDTELKLKVNPGLGAPLAKSNVKYKAPKYFDFNSNNLHCTVLGCTIDGTETGKLTDTAPLAIKELLTRSGLSADIDAASFTLAESLCQQKIGFVIPEEATDRVSISHREAINKITRSVLAIVFQDEDFKIGFHLLRPYRLDGIRELTNHDVLKLSVSGDSSNIIQSVTIEYNRKEWDQEVLDRSVSEVIASSDNAKYLIGSEKSFELETVLRDQADAEVIANRWLMLLSGSKSTLKISTKLQAADLSVGDSVYLNHKFLYDRFGSTETHKIGMVSALKKDIFGAELELDDLTNTFSRCAVISPGGSPAFEDASEKNLAYNSHVTDEYGMIDNDGSTHGINLYW